MLRIGKYRGLSFQEVALRDRSYCAWVLRERALPPTLKKFRMHLAENYGGLLTIGKHKGSKG